jgi:ubiquinone/menaquinone biosynthesis C-methylase UbiE
MAHSVCPWWLGYWLVCPFRRRSHNPAEILAPYLREGMTVLEPGSGMGFFTIELARKVGPSGRVIAVDIQPKMLDRLKRRAAKAGVHDHLEARLASCDSMGIADLANSVDFTLAFAVVHEFADANRFFTEVAEVSKRGGAILFVEPAGHVKTHEFDSELEAASRSGFSVVGRPSISRSQSALLRKG